MQYIIFVQYDDDCELMHLAPVPNNDAEYLKRIIETLQPLSEEDYMTGPAVVLHTFARSSYVLTDRDVLWCIEWEPGLIVIRFSADGTMAWSAIRSPIPNFGGRERLETDQDNYDPNDEDPQYNLIFDPWDAQFDETKREWLCFVPAGTETEAQFANALARVNAMGEIIEERYLNDLDAWANMCKQNLEKWNGEGLRLQ